MEKKEEKRRVGACIVILTLKLIQSIAVYIATKKESIIICMCTVFSFLLEVNLPRHNQTKPG